MSAVFEVPAKLALLLHLVAVDPAASLDALPTSSAGPARIERRIEADGFAFSEQRWIEALHEHGADAGQRHLSSRIFRTRGGVIYVPVDSDRSDIDAARRDARIAAPVARLAATTNAEYLSWALGRRASAVELLLAHLAGHADAGALIEAAARRPQQPASEAAPRAALAHPALFFDGTRTRSAGEVMRHVTAALARAKQRADEPDRAQTRTSQKEDTRPIKLGALEAITSGWRD